MDTERLGIDRRQEEIILQTVSEAGLFPEIIYSSRSHGILITEFIEGTPLEKSALQDRSMLTRLVEHLLDIHSIQLDLPAFNYLEHGEDYWQRLVQEELSPSMALTHRHELFVEKASALQESNSLCHHDPIPANVIESSGRIYFLDWEYARSGWPHFDFAALACEWDLDTALLCDIADCDRDAFRDAQFIYSHICELWELLNVSQGS